MRKKEKCQIFKQKIMQSELSDELYLVTKYKDGMVSCQPITAEEAAQWQAENRY